jgi:MFS family permease
MGGLGSFCTARSSAFLVRKTGSLGRTRQLMAGLGFAVAAGVMLIPSRVHDAVWVVGALALASFLCDFVIPVSWSACIDVGGRYAGTYSGSMNMMGNLGGMAGPLAVGWILQYTHRDWQLAFAISSIVYGLGAFCWMWIDPVTPLASVPKHGGELVSRS